MNTRLFGQDWEVKTYIIEMNGEVGTRSCYFTSRLEAQDYIDAIQRCDCVFKIELIYTKEWWYLERYKR